MRIKLVFAVSWKLSNTSLICWMSLCEISIACNSFCVRYTTTNKLEHLFNNWSKHGGKKHNIILLMGAAAICWWFWLTWNVTVFNNCRPKTFLHVFFRGAHWLQLWALLQHIDDRRKRLVEACQLLESLAMQFFASYGWPFILLISH